MMIERPDPQTGRYALWLPVLLAGGIGAYFWLPFEPDWRWGALAAALACGAILWGAVLHRRAAAGVFYALAAVAAGFAACVARTHSVAAPVILAETGWVNVDGRLIESFIHSDGTPRLLIAPRSITGLDAGSLPSLVRLSARAAPSDLKPGDMVRLRGRLGPPPQPTMPGAFDFGRAAFFDGIGGYGFAAGRVERLPGAEPLGPIAGAAQWIAALRDTIGKRIRAALPGTEGAVAAALIAGERSGIPEADLTAMRDSSLAHLLSISGLHMAIVGLGLFGAIRLVGALVPAIVLGTDLKKWAAAGALAGSAFYLLLSGASVPTQRSFIMIGMMFVAVMLDRTPFSLRIVAISGTLILLWAPESLLDPSFQMSFAAVAAIVAAFEVMDSPWAREVFQLLPRDTWAGRGLHALGAALATSIVAGAATAPYAGFHFNRMAVYGVAANLLAMPVVSFVIMPMGALALVVMPLGLEGLPLAVMGWGIGVLLWIAHWVASWPGASVIIASWPWTLLAVVTLGGLWAIVWRGAMRLWGLAAACLALGAAPFTEGPDLLIDSLGRNAALRAPDGSLVLASARRARFAASDWLERSGDARTGAGARNAADGSAIWACTEDVCDARPPDGPPVIVIGPRGGTGAACASSSGAIVVSARPLGVCGEARALYSPLQLAETGAVALTFSADGTIETRTVQQETGTRPWRVWPAQ
jgi:competence protein ComEC